jgi:hypothetical protein
VRSGLHTVQFSAITMDLEISFRRPLPKGLGAVLKHRRKPSDARFTQIAQEEGARSEHGSYSPVAARSPAGGWR